MLYDNEKLFFVAFFTTNSYLNVSLKMSTGLEVSTGGGQGRTKRGGGKTLCRHRVDTDAFFGYLFLR